MSVEVEIEAKEKRLEVHLLRDDGERFRLSITPGEARKFASALRMAAETAENPE